MPEDPTMPTMPTTTPTTDAPSYIGRPIRRREDQRFLTGRGKFVDDIQLPGMLHAVFLRSPHARALIRRIDTSAAEAAPGVVAVWTGQHWHADGRGDMPTIAPVAFHDGRPMNEVSRPVFALEQVQHVGDTVAMVVAQTRAQAIDAMDLVLVDYESLPSVVDTAHCLDADAAIVHEQFGSNLMFEHTIGEPDKVAQIFKSAAHIVELDVVANRITANAMEPRVYLGVYDDWKGDYILYSSTQIPHLIRKWLAESSLREPENRIQVIAPDVGGGFGPRNTHYGEEAAVLWAARRLGRPVKFLASRSDSLMTDAHGRDHVTHCRMALTREGKILGIEADTIANLGAYMTAFGPSIPAHYYPRVMSGLYTVPAVSVRIRGVYTNTVPVEAYRGAGRPEGVYVLERLLENAARELGIDVVEIRRRNLIPVSAFPYTTCFGFAYDSGNPAGLLDKLLGLVDYPALRAQQQAMRRAGKFLGIGLAGFVDCCGAPSRVAGKIGRRIGGYEALHLRIHPSGTVTLFCGTHSHGQGHETSFCQIVAEQLQVPLADVRLIEGDTTPIPAGLGTWGSRSMFLMGPAITRATDRIIARAKRFCAHAMRCEAAQVEFRNRAFHAPDGSSIPFDEMVALAYKGHDYPADLELGLEEVVFFDPPDRNFPSGIQLAVVEVDIQTGVVKVCDFAAVDDCGRVINPTIVEGQLHGGVAQGIGQALFEECSYDARSGQLLSGSFMDYTMPRADDIPSIRFAHQETLNPSNALGVKGSGESGAIAAPAAVANAVIDALWEFGIREIPMPITRNKVWRALHNALAYDSLPDQASPATGSSRKPAGIAHD
ncbi:MAG: xanthine dehydrogenase family protein molybdopterin-binding subunit [Lacisediminimonas sp.]|nr:xanthine dehydrogenase family protein molybdopterin-binding subunit [Lacisediminimonas sp.]